MLYKKKKWLAIIFALPFVAFAISLLLYPFASNFVNMFFKFEYQNDQNPVFVQWENFQSLFKDEYFLISIANTFVLIALVVVVQIGLALVLALFVNSLRKAANIYRVIFFIPVVLSGTVIGTMILMFGSSEPTGLFNQILAIFGVSHGSWLPNDGRIESLMYVLAPVVWQYIGFYFVIMLTGLANICEDFIEAAKIDGATGFKCTVFIVLPMLWNVFRTCMVLAITGALKVFDLPQVVAPGGSPLGYTYFMGTYNSSLFNQVRIGENAIYSILIVLIGISVSQISNSLLKENKDI